MKKFICICLLAVLCILPQRGRVSANCQTDNKNYGSIKLQAPDLPVTGRYNIWTRLQVPDASNNQYRLQVNGNQCFEVGGSSIQAGQWQWVSFQDGDLSHKVVYDFQKTTGNSLELIGSNPGVKIDRVLLVKSDCIPVGLGENCESAQIAVKASGTGANEVLPPTNGPVSGLVIVSPTVIQNPENIMSVHYFSDTTQLPSSNNLALDTTLLSNGTHRISMQITKKDGKVVNEVTSIEVANPQSALSPIKRWIRLNQKTAILFSSIIGVALVIFAVYMIVRQIRLNKRLLEFKGF